MPTMPNNFSGGCFERQMCAAKWVLSKRGLPTRCLVTGQSSVERESSVELLHFCDNQTPFSSAHHKLLLDAGHPSILISDWFRGYLGPPSLAVFLHNTNQVEAHTSFLSTFGIRFSIFLCQFSTLLLSEID